MKVFSKAPDEVSDRALHLMKCFYQPLIDAGLKIDFLSVAHDDPDNDKPALTIHGVPCYAIVRIVGPKERAKCNGDCEIVIDEAKWLTLTSERKDAVMDHELYHIELCYDKKGRLKLDGRGRPRIKLKHHDYDLGHFVEIARRHGSASIEVQQMTHIFLEHRQTLFEFAMDSNPAKRLVIS